jgi:hypothetical protein
MRVLVCGGRDYSDRNRVYFWLDKLFAPLYGTGDEPYKNGSAMPRPDLVIIHGGARGADSIAGDWAAINWVKFEEYKAEWNTHGKAAGCIRNQKMLDDGKPDMVLAFPGGRGTAHMVALARAAKIPVMEIPE